MFHVVTPMHELLSYQHRVPSQKTAVYFLLLSQTQVAQVPGSKPRAVTCERWKDLGVHMCFLVGVLLTFVAEG
jgi:hypothetical protein